MGSGNKDKRKKGTPGGAGPGDGFRAFTKKSKKEWEEEEEAGVSFEMEPDADRLFLESIEAMDPALLKKKAKADAAMDAGQGGGKPAAPRSDGPVEVDLHRMTLDEAKTRVEAAIDQALMSGRGETTIKIITGKGLHSGREGSVLAKEIHRHVRLRFATHIVSIEDSPAEVTIGGVPIRGHFHVTVRRR